MAKLGEYQPRQVLEGRGGRGARARAHMFIDAARKNPTAPVLLKAELSVDAAKAANNDKAVNSGFDGALRNIREDKEKKSRAYSEWMTSRDVSNIQPGELQEVYDEMRFGTIPRPTEDLGKTGDISNMDRNFLRYLLEIKAGSLDASIFSLYVYALGHAATASEYDALVERSRILGLDIDKDYAQRGQHATESASAVYHSLRTHSAEEPFFANKRIKVEKLIRELYLSEQAAVELDPTISVTYDPKDLIDNNSLSLKSEVQARALRELHRKLNATVHNLGINTQNKAEL